MEGFAQIEPQWNQFSENSIISRACLIATGSFPKLYVVIQPKYHISCSSFVLDSHGKFSYVPSQIRMNRGATLIWRHQACPVVA
jgi:hypothetical protein